MWPRWCYSWSARSDAKADVNLVANGDFSLGNTGFTSQYVYTTNLFPEDTYVVGDNPNHFHPQGANFGDHTTGTGLMLIANWVADHEHDCVARDDQCFDRHGFRFLGLGCVLGR